MQTDYISGHLFLEKYSRQLYEFTLYAYEHFLEEGRGVLIVDENGDDGAKYHYTSQPSTPGYELDLREYNPDNHIYFVWKRPNYPDECFIYEDPNLLGRPKWRYKYRNGF